MQPTWVELEEAEHGAIWDRFDRRFGFRPDVQEFPGFDEPLDSITFALSGMFGDEDRYWRIRRDCESAFLEAARGVVAAGEFIYALDWQHPAYRFWPHRPVEVDHLGDWTVPFLPNGDYYCFVEPQLQFGTLGHPWEETLCVFGARLSEELESGLTELLGLPIRRGGKVVRQAPPRCGNP